MQDFLTWNIYKASSSLALQNLQHSTLHDFKLVGKILFSETDILTIALVPWVVVGFFKLITPFIDPHTRQKLKFSEDMRQYVPTEQLWTVFNGDVDFQYEHDVYWPAFLKLCAERRAAYKARWEKAGKIYGESEVYMKGGNVPSIGGGERASSEDEPEKENAKADAVKVAAPSLEEVSSEMAIPQETNETPVEDAKETVVAESQVAEAVKTES